MAWAPTVDEGVELAHRIWPTSGLPGELAQILPNPAHFEQASTLITRESTRDSVTAGNDPARHVEAFAPYLDAGFDEVFVAKMGPHYGDILRTYGEAVLPALRSGQDSAWTKRSRAEALPVR